MPVNEELAAEMETAVDEVVKENAAEVASEEKKDATATTKDTQEADPKEVTKEETKETTEETTNERIADENTGEGTEGVSSEETGEDTGKKAEVTSSQTQISDETLTRAVQAGIPLEVAKTFQSEATLSAWIADKVQIATSTTEVKTETEEEDPLDALKLDLDVYEPEVIEAFNKVTNELRQQRDQLKTLSETTQQSAEATQGAATREIEGWFDGQCEELRKLGDDFIEALGKGGNQSLNRGSSQFAKRVALAEQVGILVAGYQATGQQPPPRDELFNVAARMTLGDEFQKIHERKLTADLRKRSSQHISRAGGQQATQRQSTEEEIAATLDEKYFKK